MLLGNPEYKTRCQNKFLQSVDEWELKTPGWGHRPQRSSKWMHSPSHIVSKPAFVSEDGLSKTPISRTTLLFPTFEGCTWSSIRTVFLNELSQSLSNLATSLSLGSSASSIWPSMMPWTLFPPWLLPSLSQLSCVFWDTENMSPFWEAVSASPSIWASWL